MDTSRRITMSLAAFVLLCFFLPWVQLSGVGVKDAASGFDLARGGDKLLWLIPSFMILIILLGLVRLVRERAPAVFALAGTVGGSLSAYLMQRERSSADSSSTLVATQWSAPFWLGFIACLGIVAAALIFYGKRSRSP